VLYSSGGRASLRAAAASENWVEVGVMLQYMCMCGGVCGLELGRGQGARCTLRTAPVAGTHRDNRSACHRPCEQHKRMPLHSNVRLREAQRVLGTPYPLTR
jgi:hypothetical protein